MFGFGIYKKVKNITTPCTECAHVKDSKQMKNYHHLYECKCFRNGYGDCIFIYKIRKRNQECKHFEQKEEEVE